MDVDVVAGARAGAGPGAVATWGEFARAAPELAAKGLARFDATGLSLIGTLRRDGSPRISAVEPFVFEGQLALGMMWRSMKALDLMRDPRCVVHSTISNKDGTEGEFKVYGPSPLTTSRPGTATATPSARRRAGRRKAMNGTCGSSPPTRCPGSAPWGMEATRRRCGARRSLGPMRRLAGQVAVIRGAADGGLTSTPGLLGSWQEMTQP